MVRFHILDGTVLGMVEERAPLVLKRMLAECLTDRERLVLCFYYGLLGGAKAPTKTIASRLGVTPGRVGQIRLRAMMKLRMGSAFDYRRVLGDCYDEVLETQRQHARGRQE